MLKKGFYLLFYLTTLINSGFLYGNDSISVTYIANCGYLLEMDSSKIIVDGLFKSGHNRYSIPDTTTQKLLVSNQYPFNDLDLILVTHTHEDHFDSEMVVTCMQNNETVKLLCPQQVIDEISKYESAYEKIKTRIIECTPDAFTSQFVQVGNIEINACRFAHPGERHKNVQNIAYLVSINNKSFFHSADIDPLQINKYTGIKLNDLNIDIGFINEDFAKIENSGSTKELINAKCNVAMHLPDTAASVWIESFKDNPDLFRNPFIFTKKMDKKVFYKDNLE